MDKEELKNSIKAYMGSHVVPDIPCCQDDTSEYDAYNNVDKMYDHNKVDAASIRIFLEYGADTEKLAEALHVDYYKLNDMFRFSQVPSKGIACAISLVLGLSMEDTEAILGKMAYHLGNDDWDKIVRYFFVNDIRDPELLSEMLVSFGCMYLYSKKKLR